jgi:hypothetical protein
MKKNQHFAKKNKIISQKIHRDSISTKLPSTDRYAIPFRDPLQYQTNKLANSVKDTNLEQLWYQMRKETM